MKKELLYGIGGLVVGAAISSAVAWAVTMNQSDTGVNMSDGIVGKTGDAFDKAFLETMIAHHQGALTMAEEAKDKAKHPELKSFAENILSAQGKDIQQMKDWQMAWGYSQMSDSQDMNMHHH